MNEYAAFYSTEQLWFQAFATG